MTPTYSRGTHAKGHRGRGPLALALAALALMAAPASAHALGFNNLSSAPVTPPATNTNAGANADFNIHIEFTDPGDDVETLTIGLPPGQIGDPTATPMCTVAELNSAGGCPAETQVGALESTFSTLLIPLGVPVSGALYNLVPQPGEPARFGIILTPAPPLPVGQIKLESAVELRQTDFGLNTIIDNIPNTAAGLLPIDILSMDVTLFGTAGGNPFSRNPTSCELAVTNFAAVGRTGDPAAGQASYTPTGCPGALPFDPKFSAEVEVPNPLDPGGKPSLTTVIEQTAAEAGLRDATVVVPPDFGADFDQILPGEVCLPAQFQSHSCPAQAQVGTALATSPLLTAPLTGPVYLVDNPGSLVKVGLDLQGQLSMLLQGQLGLDGSTAFIDLPDIPIAHFELKFIGGQEGLLVVNRDVCRPPAPSFHTEFLAHSGVSRAADTPSSVKGCGPERLPKLSVRFSGSKSEHPRLTMRARAASGFQPLRRVKLKLPPGLAFAGGAASRGIEGSFAGTKLKSSAIRASGRRLRLTLPSYGAPAVKVKVRGAALKRTGSLPDRIKFKAKVIDTSGTAIALRARVRAKG